MPQSADGGGNIRRAWSQVVWHSGGWRESGTVEEKRDEMEAGKKSGSREALHSRQRRQD